MKAHDSATQSKQHENARLLLEGVMAIAWKMATGKCDASVEHYRLLHELLHESERLEVESRGANEAGDESFSSMSTKARALADRCIASTGVFAPDATCQLSVYLASRILNALVFGRDWLLVERNGPAL